MRDDDVTAEAAPIHPEPALLGGYTALVEGAWMGSPQGADVLESLHSSSFRLRWPRCG